MNNILITNIRIVPNPENSLIPLQLGWLYIKDGRIVSVKVGEAPEKLKLDIANEVIDGRGGIALPGIHNAHTHVEQALMERIGDGLNLSDWLSSGIRELTTSMDENDMYWAALCAFMRYISEGATCVVVHQKNCSKNSLCNAVIKAAQSLGIRILLLRGWREHGRLGETAKNAIKSIESLIEKYKDSNDVRIGLAIPSYWNCSYQGIKYMAEASKNMDIIVQIHISETADEIKKCEVEPKGTPVKKIYDAGLMSGNVELVHGVWLTEDDIQRVSLSGASIVHCPGSNFFFGSGISPVRQLLDANINVSLGTDGATGWKSSSVLMEAVYTSMASRIQTRGDRPILIDESTKLVWKARSQLLWSSSSAMGLVEGGQGDITIFERINPIFNWPAYGETFSAASLPLVRIVICQGKTIFRDGIFVQLNNENDLGNIEQLSKKFRKVVTTYVPLK